jgi:hypothetical protein
MEKTRNVTLYKGFEKRADGTLWCRDYCFGQESEIVGKTFTLNNKEPLVMCENGFHACDSLGKTLDFYPKDGKNVFYRIRAKEAYYEDAQKMVFRTFNVIKEAELDVLDGNCNTGGRNTGGRNTGSRNTGSRNTGDYNTGSHNTGSRNLCNNSAGFFAIEEPKADCFGLPTEFTISEFRDKFGDIIYTTPSFYNLMKLPNATKELVEAYMEKFNRLKKQ